MKALLLIATAGTAGFLTFAPCGTFSTGACSSEASACPAGDAPERGPLVTSQLVAPAVTGDYVEARSASVFAGACHTGSEAASQGRQALMAWSLDDGAHGGVELAGVRLVAAVSADENLDRACERRAAVWIDAPGGAAQAAAAEAWLVAEHGATLGALVDVERAPVRFERAGDAFRVAVEGRVQLAGDALADRSCCTMQEERYYEPLAAEAGAVVGVPSECRFEGLADLPAWRFEDANSAFVARFESSGPGAATAAPCAMAAPGDCSPEPAAACGTGWKGTCSLPSRASLD